MPTISHSSSLVLSLLKVNRRQEIYHFFPSLALFLANGWLHLFFTYGARNANIYPFTRWWWWRSVPQYVHYFITLENSTSKHFFGATLPSWVVHLVWKIRAHSNFCLSIANHHHYSCLPAMSWNCTALEKEMHCPFSFLCACSTAHLNRHSSFLLLPI